MLSFVRHGGAVQQPIYLTDVLSLWTLTLKVRCSVWEEIEQEIF